MPVVVEHDGRRARAWAWAERAWEGTPWQDKAPSVPADEARFSLGRLTWERLGIADAIRSGECVVSVHVPRAVTVSRVWPLIHDLPLGNQVQVAADFPGPVGDAVMLRNGVAASVTVVVREHVRSGTFRIANHLRSITDPADGADPEQEAVFLRPAPRRFAGASSKSPRTGTRVSEAWWGAQAAARSGIEGMLRWFFGAEEQAVRVVRAHPGDSHQQVVSVSDALLTRLGVRSGDKVVIGWLGTETEVTALKDHRPVEAESDDRGFDPLRPGPAQAMPPDLAVRVPAALGYLMNLPVGSVITMRRSTRSVLARNLNNLILPVAALALAGAALNDPDWRLVIAGAVATALLGLSRLRMSKRRAVRLSRQD
ncbi:hypothetical protein [Myceligenerans halotolerans]